MTFSAVDSAAGAAVVEEKRHRPFFGKTRKMLRVIPAFAYFLVLYAAIEYSTPDMNQVFLALGYHQFTALHVIFFFGMMMIPLECARVARPSVGKMNDVIVLWALTFVYFALWLIGIVLVANGKALNFMRIFNTAEFLIFTASLVVTSIASSIIVANTLQRTIDATTMDTDSHHH